MKEQAQNNAREGVKDEEAKRNARGEEEVQDEEVKSNAKDEDKEEEMKKGGAFCAAS